MQNRDDKAHINVTATLWPDILEAYNAFYDLNNGAPRFWDLND